MKLSDWVHCKAVWVISYEAWKVDAEGKAVVDVPCVGSAPGFIHTSADIPAKANAFHLHDTAMKLYCSVRVQYTVEPLIIESL